jgi:hypothetical protein
MRLPLRPCTSGLALLAATWTLGGAFVPSSIAQEADAVRDKLDRFSTLPMLIAAEELGVTEIQGKDISNPGGSPGHAEAKKLLDVPIGVHPTKHENEPTVAANPKDKKRLVAGSHYFGPPAPTLNRCVAYTSADGGETWSTPFPMPQLTALSECSDPVLAYAPDGSRVYYAYMDIKAGVDWDIVMSYSDDDGRTWTGPILVLDASVPGGFLYDKPWIGTHVDDNESNWVYVTATRFAVIAGGSDAIAFTRSSDFGVTWSTPPTFLDVAPSFVVVQGSRPAGGVGGEVLVAWYNSGSDGWLSGGFEIRTRRSGDHGATFDPVTVASHDSFELPYWLGPFAFYHRWWGGMFPDIAIDPGGEAHIVYTHDPVAGSATAEDGDIRYITSGGPPYDMWSSPVTINDDGLGRAQGYPAINTQHGGQSSHLHAIWEDHRLSPALPIAFPNSPNLFYDIFYARKVPGQGVGWSTNFRVSDASSINDYVFIGDYNDLTATSSALFAIWTDRRDKLSIFDFEDDVYGSVISAGGAVPSTP